jgi:hypothetical protein
VLEPEVVPTVPAAAAPADLIGTSIVIVGQFDPRLLQPANLLSNGLLVEDDIAQLRYDVLAPEITIAKLPWMQLIIEADKLTASSTIQNPAAEPVRDFVFALCDMVPIRRFTAIGINHDTHFAVSSEDIWHKIGHTLVPKDDWRKVIREPGMLSLTMRGQRDDAHRGSVNVKVEPSMQIRPGIYVNVNDHFDADEKLLNEDPSYLLRIVGESWDESNRRSEKIVTAVKGLM